jgi:hypothetical protein
LPRLLQKCCKVAPQPPPGTKNGKAWKLKHCVYTDVKLDKNCSQCVCPKCYVGCWNHTAKTLASGAKAHCDHRV